MAPTFHQLCPEAIGQLDGLHILAFPVTTDGATLDLHLHKVLSLQLDIQFVQDPLGETALPHIDGCIDGLAFGLQPLLQVLVYRLASCW